MDNICRFKTSLVCFLSAFLALALNTDAAPFSFPHRNLIHFDSSQPSDQIQMARALSTFSPFKSLLSDGISVFICRRGFAAAAEAVRRSPKADDKAAAVAQLLAGKRRVAGAADPDPWVPDPVTGYYRPSNRVVEVDAAELRAMLLRPKP
ncbi:hypothetical protein LUZ61_020975 [Rhynchospora tenuis]|uniref:Uncharacterized protein n=1 Tax=Rhynchospora tenuis TaxID=198213 RepID=A0AAD5ZE06_9POAL|nr:hypothetical protein LUZ61_020975 [Rhynchospora tenuis]